jgi:hypothetical protein
MNPLESSPHMDAPTSQTQALSVVDENCASWENGYQLLDSFSEQPFAPSGCVSERSKVAKQTRA